MATITTATPKQARKAIKETKDIIAIAIAGPLEHMVIITKAEANLVIKQAEISGYIITLFQHPGELDIGISEA